MNIVRNLFFFLASNEKKDMKNRFLLLLLCLVTLSCENSDDTRNSNSNSQFSQNFGQSAQRDFMGQIVDENNNPIENALVKIGSNQVNTDVNGVFILKNADVFEKFAYIKVQKSGFIDGSRSIVPTQGMNQVKIMMIANAPVATVSSNQLSEVSLSNGTKINFDGFFEDQDGNAYSGAVSVFAYHLESSNSNLTNLMPGMLFAEAEDGSPKVLQTFGMINVELKGSSGEKIKIANNHSAKISMKIDDTQLATAANSIPLWHFDEENGYWKEEGEATRQGDYYVGNVSHFSWWNCDAPFETVTLCLKIVNENNEPLVGVQVNLSFLGQANSRIAFSNNDGEICGLVPANEILTLEVLDFCGNIVYSNSVGPFSTDTVLSSITIGSNLVSQSIVKGKLINCNDVEVTKGYVLFRHNNETILKYVTNGDFEFSTFNCNSNFVFTLTGVDYDNLQTTGNIFYTFSTGLTDLGRIPVCTNIDEFISFTVNDLPSTILIDNINHLGWPGTSISNADFTVSSNLPYGSVPAFHMDLIENFTIGIPSSNSSSIHLWYNNGTSMTYAGGGLNASIVTINKYDSPGGYVDFTFKIDIPGSGIFVTGIGHVKRSN